MLFYFYYLIFSGEEKVEVKNFSLNAQSTKIKKKRVGVLISGSGEFINIFVILILENLSAL